MSSSPTETALVDVLMPQMGTSIAEGTIVGWSKAVGDRVAVDETICEITTDKVDSECPSPASGELVEILAEVGATVEVGAVIGRIAVAQAVAVLRSSTEPPTSEQPPGVGAPDGEVHRRTVVSPVVRRVAQTHDVELAQVRGTGRNGRITKRDVLDHVAARDRRAPALHSDSPYRPEPDRGREAAEPSTIVAATDMGGVTEPLSRIRIAIGTAMRRSQETSATAHTVFECDMSAVERRRRELGLTALPIVAHATIDALRDFPDLNATLDGHAITRYDRVHLGVAVSLGADGLIVPVVRDAQHLSEAGLADRIKDLAQRARAKQLGPDDVGGATFTITSPGAAGALIATPIVPVPQVAILDLEAIVRRPVVVDDGRGGESIAIRAMAHLVLGWDHRAIDGMTAASFLGAIRRRLEGLD